MTASVISVWPPIISTFNSLEASPASSIIIFKSFSVVVGGANIAVSYTHLDVYKRQAYDQIRFFFKQGDVIKEGTPVTLTPDAISDGGKTATFTIDIPAGIDGNAAYTLYAVHGSPFISLDVAGKINVQVLPAEFWTLTNLNKMCIRDRYIGTF